MDFDSEGRAPRRRRRSSLLLCKLRGWSRSHSISSSSVLRFALERRFFAIWWLTRSRLWGKRGDAQGVGTSDTATLKAGRNSRICSVRAPRFGELAEAKRREERHGQENNGGG